MSREYQPELKATVLHESLACSSVALGYVFTPLYFHEKSLKDFALEVSKKLAKGVGIYPAEKFSFCLVSSSDSLGDTMPYDVDYYEDEHSDNEGQFWEDFNASKKTFDKYLEALGFTPTPWSWNSKNETDVRLWTIPMADLLKNLKEIINGK